MNTSRDLLDKTITKNVLDWYRRSHRDLPWRRTRDPFSVWVSEVMLQQTQVRTVVPYYERFLVRFPDVAALAAAPLDQVLKAWEGLGYYARARNLHTAAKVVVERHGSAVPDDPEVFRSLPGVGDYIAAAVQSIAFGRLLPVVDGNVKRVLARLTALTQPIDGPAGRRAVLDAAQRLLDRSDPGTFNQAMMELGARVCRPTRPACTECPIAAGCEALRRGDPESFPVRAKRRRVPFQRIAVAVVTDGERLLITQRRPHGLLGGLWEFPGGKIRQGEEPEAACAREIREEVSLVVEVGERIACVRHAYTHLMVELEVFRCRYTGGEVVLNGPTDYRWIVLDDIAQYAFPKANHKFIQRLRDRLDLEAPDR